MANSDQQAAVRAAASLNPFRGAAGGSADVTDEFVSAFVSFLEGAGYLASIGAVTFTDTGDVITHNAHGLDNGDKVVFDTIVSTTGLTAGTEYFVVSSTTNTFKASATSGGSAVALTTDGTGNVSQVLHDKDDLRSALVAAAEQMEGAGKPALVTAQALVLAAAIEGA